MDARRSYLLVTLALLLARLTEPGALCAQADQAYQAYIAADEAEVYAGPGRRFYATALLARGDAVEVHRQEPGGWLAIRPPEGSFSWVPAAALVATDEPDVFRVKDATPSWIGTQAEIVREHKSQVELRPGELVEALGERTVPGENGVEQKWIKIAPPAGEFRYLLAREITRSTAALSPAPSEGADPPLTPVAGPRAAPQTPFAPLRTAGISPIPLSPAPATARQRPLDRPPQGSGIELFELASAPRGGPTDQAADEPSRIALAQFQAPAPRSGPPSPRPASGTSTPRGESKPKVALSPDGFVARRPRPVEGAFTKGPAANERSFTDEPDRLASLPPSDRGAPAQPTAATPPRATPAAAASSGAPRGPAPTAEEAVRELEAVDLELTQILAQPQITWNFALLKQRAGVLVDQGPTAEVRGQARLLREKIARFEQAFDVPENPAPLAAANAAAAAAETLKPGVLPSDPRYDGVGFLQETRAASPDAQQRVPYPFALVDAEGKLLAFVSPSGGFNPRAYLGRQVGVYGRRGFVAELRAPHIAAEKMIKLR